VNARRRRATQYSMAFLIRWCRTLVRISKSPITAGKGSWVTIALRSVICLSARGAPGEGPLPCPSGRTAARRRPCPIVHHVGEQRLRSGRVLLDAFEVYAGVGIEAAGIVSAIS
jgi:hypothetical protein